MVVIQKCRRRGGRRSRSRSRWGSSSRKSRSWVGADEAEGGRSRGRGKMGRMGRSRRSRSSSRREEQEEVPWKY